MINSILAGPRLKIQRAKKHLDDLENLLGAFVERKPYSILVERDASREYWVPRIKEDIPQEASLILGDLVHNLHSALDLLIVGIVKPAENQMRTVQFPFASDLNDLQKQIIARHIDRAGNAVVAAIHKIAPYRGEGGNVWLSGLHQLDIADKHRLIIPVVGATRISGRLTNATGLNWDLSDEKWSPLTDGVPVMRLPHTDNLKEGDEIDATFSIDFGKSQAFEGQPVLTTLVALTDYIDRVVQSFEKLLPSLSMT